MTTGRGKRSRWGCWLAAASVALSLAVGAAGCGGGGSSSPTSPSGTGSDMRTVQADPSYGSVVQEIFERRGCTASTCHGSAVSAGLTLQRGASHAALVNVQATSEPIIRVIPGNADGSYLVIKLEGRQAVGTRMPQTGTPLDSIDLTNIKNWINQGAKNN